MRNTVTLVERIAVRAYYLAEASGWQSDPVDCWLVAERMELDRSAKLKRSAAKGAATRRAKRDATHGDLRAIHKAMRA